MLGLQALITTVPSLEPAFVFLDFVVYVYGCFARASVTPEGVGSAGTGVINNCLFFYKELFYIYIYVYI